MSAAASVFAQEKKPAADEDTFPGRRIFVPLDELDVLFDRDKPGVIMPRDEFLKLYEAAKTAAESAPRPTSAVVLSRAAYKADLAGDQLAIHATIELTQFAPGWQALPLAFRGVSVESALLDDKPAQIGRAPQGDRPLLLFLNQPGKHTLKLALSANLVTAGSDQATEFGFPAIASATLELTLPAGKNLRMDEVPLERPAAIDQPAPFALAIGGKNALSLRITDRETQNSSAALVFAATAIGVRVAPEELTWRAVTTLQVYGTPIDSLEFAIPKSLDIVSIESTGLERWEIAPGPNEATTLLKLAYRQKFQETRTVTFQGVASTVIGQPWSVPGLTLNRATSQIAHVVVQHPPGLRVQVVEMTGVRRIAADEDTSGGVPDMPVAGDPTLALHFAAWQPDFALVFVTQPKARELQATIATRVDVDSSALSLRSSINVQSRFAPLFELDVTLPAEWTITDVMVGNSPAVWRVVPLEAGLHKVRISLKPPIPADGRAELIVNARQIPAENWPVEDKPLLIKLPEVALPQAGVTEGTYMIAAERDLDVAIPELTGLDPAQLPATQQQLANAPRLVYQYQDTRFGGQLKITRKPARIAARTLAFHRLDPQILVSHLEARVAVSGGGVRKLQVALPEAAGTDLQFQLVGSGLRIVEQTAEAPANGSRVWNLQFDQRAHGGLWLVVDLKQPRGKEAKDFPLPAMTVSAAERQDGYIAVEAGPDQQLTLKATSTAGQPLKEIDPADMLMPAGYAPKERIVAAYHAVLPGYTISLQETRFERLAVPTAICDRSVLTSVLGESGEFQHQAEFQIRAVGVQSLSIELPAAATLWATLIDGQPTEVRRFGSAVGGVRYFVPVSASAQPEAQRTLQLFYRTGVAELGNAGILRQQAPKVTVVNGTGETQPLEILSRTWNLNAPGHTEIIQSLGAFEPTEKLSRESLLGWLQRRFSVASPTELLWKSAYVAAVVLLVGMLTIAMRRRRVIQGFLVLSLLGLVSLLLPAFQGVYTSQKSSPAPTSAPMSVMTDAITDDGAAFTDLEGRDFHRSKKSQRESVHGITSATPGSGPQRRLAVESKQESAMDELSQDSEAPSSAEGMLGGRGLAASQPLAPPMIGMPGQDGVRVQLKGGGGAGMGGGMGGAPPQRASRSMLANPQKTANPFGVMNGNAPAPAAEAPPAGAEVALQAPAPPADAAPQAPAQPQAAAAAPQGDDEAEVAAAGSKSKAGGLLSLALQVQAPAGSRVTQFTYIGEPVGDAAPELAFEYQDARSLSLLDAALASGILLLFWLLRRRGRAVRAVVAVFGLALPLALSSIAPTMILPFLDGIFLGALLGVALWTLLAIVSAGCKAWNAAAPSALRISSAALLIAVVATFGADSGPARAAEDVPQAAAQPAPAPAAAQPKLSQAFDEKDVLVIPYDSSEKDPLKSERVFLPYAKFVQMWNLAHPEKRKTGPAPVSAIVAETLYAAKVVEGDAKTPAQAEITARIVFHSFVDDQTTVALPFAPVAFASAQLDGKAAPIITRETPAGAELAVVLEGTGVHVFDGTFKVPVERRGPAGKFTLPLKPLPAGAVRFTLPGNDLVLKVNGTGGVFRQSKQGTQTIAVIPVDMGGDLTLSWGPAQTRDAVEGIVHADAATAVVLEDGGIKISSRFDLQVRQGGLAEVSFSLPKELSVRQISGPDVGGWEIAGEAAQRTLKVFLRRKITDSTSLLFDLFMVQSFTRETAAVAVPPFAPLGLTRETGTLGVFSGNQFSVTAGAVTGLTQIDAGQFPPPSRVARPEAPPLLAYRYAARPFQLQLLIGRQLPQSTGSGEHALLVTQRKVRLWSRIELSLAGAPRSEIGVRLPAGYLLYDLQSPEVADFFVEQHAAGDADKKEATLYLQLTAPRTGVLSFTMDGVIPRKAEDLAPQLGVPAPLGMNELRSSAAIWLDPLYSGNIQDFAGWKSIDPEQLAPRLRGLREAPVQFAFSSVATLPQPIGVALKQAVPVLSADSLTTIVAGESAIHSLLSLQWNIAQAAESTFSFTTPDSLEGKLDFSGNRQGPRMRQVASEKIDRKRIRWTITLEEPLRARYFVTARSVLPPPAAGGTIAAPRIEFEQPSAGGNAQQFSPLATQQQYLLLVNQSPYQLELEKNPAVDAVTPDQLPIKISPALVEQAADVLKVRGKPEGVVWQVRAMQQIKRLGASVNLAEMVLVLALDGSWRAQANYRINNRSRQFLALRMPEGATILSLFVAGQAARPVHTKRGNADAVLIPLPKTAAGDLSAEVKLVFAGRFARPLPRGVQVARTTLDLPAPRVLSQEEDAEFGMPVARTSWTVYAPNDIDAKPLDDAGRTNVVESVEGQDRLAAELGEALQLFSEATSVDSSYRSRIRAQDNLKQLDVSFSNNSSLQQALQGSDSDGKQREIAEAYKRVESLKKEAGNDFGNLNNGAVIQGQPAGAKGMVKLDVQQVEQDLIVSNSIAIPADGIQLSDNLGFRLPESSTPADARSKGSEQAEKKPQTNPGLNRAQLRDQNYTQSFALNENKDRELKQEASAEEQGRSGGGKQPMGRPGAGVAGPGPGQMAPNAPPNGRGDTELWIDLGQKEMPEGKSFVPLFGITINDANVDADNVLAFGDAKAPQGAGMQGGDAANAGFVVNPQSGAGWSRAGGLSLLIDVPREGQELVFSKAGGDAKLALGMRPVAALQFGFGILWTLVWLMIAAVLIAALSRADIAAALSRRLPLVLVAVGLVWYFLLPQFAVVGFTLFVAGALTFGWQHRREPA